jgi:hypothetical protein
MLKSILSLLVVNMTLLGFTQTGTLHRVFTFANIADITDDTEFVEQLKVLLNIDESYTVLITGDLVHSDASNGISNAEEQKIERILQACQRSEQSRVIILPGDRDWDDSGKDGLKSVKELRKIIEKMNLPRVEWAIMDGCPGPKSFDLTAELVLIGIDTQWWNHPFDHPEPADGDCNTITETDILSELSELIDDAEGKNILLAGHFPLISVGEYGGKSKWTEHLTPPLYGSMKAAYHQNIGGVKDIHNVRFDPFRKELLKMIRDNSSIIYVSGHEHNLQIIKEEGSYLINSGSPTSAHHVGREAGKLRFAEAIPGLVEIFYHSNGKVDCMIYESIPQGTLELIHTEALFSSPCADHGVRHQVNTHFVPCLERSEDDTGTTSALSMTSKGGDYKVGTLTKAILGNHYRSTWTQPIHVPFIDLKETRSGLKVYEKGGGRQTTSLKMKGGDGREYVFRSVDKQPTRVLDANLRETIVSRILQDATSMQQPYGAMAISTMLDHTDILHASPELFILPDDPELGPFRKEYAGLLGMLEEKPINPNKVDEPFADADEILQSYKLIREQYNDHDHRIDYKEYAQARMFDIFVGDWGRHQDNWKWAGYKQENGMIYRPIPRDRDHVFSRWDGLLPYLADRKWGKASGENFSDNIHDIRSLTWQTRHSDRFWLNEASRQDWVDAAADLQIQMTDEVIDEAMRNMPAETLELSGLEIASKLKHRREDLKKYAEEYYELLAKEVDVVGSNERERFEAIRHSDGTVQITMYSNSKDGKNIKQLYQRQFFPKETKEIRLYGLGGDDEFNISGESRKSIRIRVMGGPGVDSVSETSVVEKGKKRTSIYENSDKSLIELGTEGKRVLDADPSLYNYDRTRFVYNRYGPILNIGYNSTNGFGITSGLTFTNQRFGKPDYSSKHKIVGRATTEGIAKLTYDGMFRHIVGRWDLTVGAEVADKSDFVRFYGIGNGVPITETNQNVQFFQTEFRNALISVGLERTFWKRSTFGFKTHYENNTAYNEGYNILALLPDGTAGLKDANLLEGILSLDLDFRDRSSVPTRGMRLYIQHRSGINTFESNKDYHLITGQLENHSTFTILSPWTLSLSLRGSTSKGEEVIPFYKKEFLGQRTGLRGYQNNRFTGTSTLVFSSELRIQLSEISSTFIPFKLGIKGFLDSGRVYSDQDVTNQLYTGYGAGFYIVPLTESLTIDVSYGISNEETGLILFSFGTVFQ